MTRSQLKSPAVMALRLSAGAQQHTSSSGNQLNDIDSGFEGGDDWQSRISTASPTPSAVSGASAILSDSGSALRRPPLPPQRTLSSSSSASSASMAGSAAHAAGAAQLAGCVQVAVRLRPITADEAKRDARHAVVAADSEYSTSLSLLDLTLAAKRSTPGNGALGAQKFGFDHVFGIEASQETVFTTAVAPVLTHFVEGFNVTVLAYGQTGTGKTFTMGTASPQISRDESARGIVPRAAEMVFDMLEAKSQEVTGFSYSAKVSFLEIYNDDVIDLFDSIVPASSNSPTPRSSARPVSMPSSGNLASKQRRAGGAASSGREPLAVRFDKTLGTTVQGARYLVASSVEDIERLLVKGTNFRQTAATSANATSSRSHAIFTIIITQEFVLESGATTRLVSKLNFVDLAGSERLKNTNAVGDRAKEGISINSGLLALGKVINALATPAPRSGTVLHIPYRDSKLTRLLQDSLGGNSQTLMIACISPTVMDLAESKSTIQFASRARSVRIRSTANRVDSYEKPDEDLREQLRIMREQLTEARAEVKATELRSTALGAELDFKSQVCLDMQDHIEILLNDITELREERYMLAASRGNTEEGAARLSELELNLSTRDAEVEIVIREYQKELDQLRLLVAERENQLEYMSVENELRLFEIMQRVSRIADRVELTTASIEPIAQSTANSTNSSTLISEPHTGHTVQSITAQQKESLDVQVQNFGSWFDGWLTGSTFLSSTIDDPEQRQQELHHRRARSMAVLSVNGKNEDVDTDRLRHETAQPHIFAERMEELSERVSARLRETDDPVAPTHLADATASVHMMLERLMGTSPPANPIDRKKLRDMVRAKLSWIEGWLEGSNGSGLPIGINAGWAIDNFGSWLDGWLAGLLLTAKGKDAADKSPMPSQRRRTRSLATTQSEQLQVEDEKRQEFAQSAQLVRRMLLLTEHLQSALQKVGNGSHATDLKEQLTELIGFVEALLQKLTAPERPLTPHQRRVLGNEIRVYLSWVEGWLEGSSESGGVSEAPATTEDPGSAQQTVQQHLLLSYFQEMEELRMRANENDQLRARLSQRLAVLEASERALYQRSIESHLSLVSAASPKSGKSGDAMDVRHQSSSSLQTRDIEILELSRQLQQLKSQYSHLLTIPPERFASTSDDGSLQDIPTAVDQFGQRLAQIQQNLASQRDMQRHFEQHLVDSREIEELQESFARLFGKYFDSSTPQSLEDHYSDFDIRSMRDRQSSTADSVILEQMAELSREAAEKDRRIAELEQMLMENSSNRRLSTSSAPNSRRRISSVFLSPPPPMMSDHAASSSGKSRKSSIFTIAEDVDEDDEVARGEQFTVEQHFFFSYLNDMAQVHMEVSGSNYRSNDISDKLSQLQKARSAIEQGEDLGSFPMFQKLVTDLVGGVRKASELEEKLRSAEARLRARDNYLQSTIMDTARRVNDLEQSLTDLEADKEMLISDLETSLAERRELESILLSLGLDARNKDFQQLIASRKLVIVDETTAAKLAPLPSPEAAATTSHSMETDVETSATRAWQAAESVASDVGMTDASLDDLSEMTDELTGLVEQNELLQSDLSLVRLQVEHLEAVSRERNAVISELLKKLGQGEPSGAHAATAGKASPALLPARPRSFLQSRPRSIQNWADALIAIQTEPSDPSTAAQTPDILSPTTASTFGRKASMPFNSDN